MKKTISVGAPQVIEKLCKLDAKTKKDFQDKVIEAAGKGYRTLAVAIRTGSSEKSMNLVGLMFLADPIRQGAKEIIAYLRKNGIDTKMLTGDNYEISKRISTDLGINGVVIEKNKVQFDRLTDEQLRNVAAFSEVLPRDKYEIALRYQKSNVIAVTGDGVNDLPAMKVSNASIAVNNAVDALKGSSDIVLLAPGIGVIKDAIIESRKIFTRLYTYSVYRISESVRLVASILVLGLWLGGFPLTPLQLLILAFLNDLPIISLAFDNVKNTTSPSKINVKKRFINSSLFGLIGVINSVLLVFIIYKLFNFPIDQVQTLFFLKLAIGGHMLVYVVHTDERWFKFLPNKAVIWATTLTQLGATLMAYFGIFMTKVSPLLILFIWIWCFVWMQVSEEVKMFEQKYLR